MRRTAAAEDRGNADRPADATTGDEADASWLARGKQFVDTGARKVEQAGKAAAGGATKAGQVAGAGFQQAKEGLKRGVRSVKRRRGSEAQAALDKEAIVLLHELPEEVKLTYLKALVWLTYQDDRQIDQKEVAELHLLMVQIGCNAESRQAVRNAIEDPAHLAADEIVESLREQTEQAQWTSVACSLLKDAIRIDRSSSTTAGVAVTLGVRVPGGRRHEKGVRALADLLGVTDGQIVFIEEACVQDQEILDGQISDRRLTETAKDLAAKSAAVGVPITAVYLSGSVTGLSAAGITSGLAALGLGGILGLSAMVSGLGIAVVGGAVIYRGTRWLMGGSARARAERREVLLKEVLRNQQKALANLAEDIGHVGGMLVRATEGVRINHARIQKLAREMTLFRGALKELRDTNRSLEDQIRRQQDGTEADAAAEQDAADASPEEPEPNADAQTRREQARTEAEDPGDAHAAASPRSEPEPTTEGRTEREQATSQAAMADEEHVSASSPDAPEPTTGKHTERAQMKTAPDDPGATTTRPPRRTSRRPRPERTTLNAGANVERVLIVQDDQIRRVHCQVDVLNRHAEELQEEAADQGTCLDDLEAGMAENSKEAGTPQPSAEALEHVRVDPDLLLSDQEIHEIRQRLPDLSFDLDLPDADGGWNAYMRDVDAYIEKHGIDVDRDPLIQLLPPGRAAELIRQFDEDYGRAPWDGWDWVMIGFTVVAGSLLDYFLVATPGAAFKGVPQRGSPVTAWLRQQSEKLAPMTGADGLERNALQQTVAGLTTKAEAWAKVPYDVVSPKRGLTPNTHRIAAIGHDPVLGLVFGVKDIITGNCSFIDANGRWQVIQGVTAGEKGVLAALVEVIVHGFSDAFTAKSLPPPFLSALQTLKVDSGFTLREGGDTVSATNLVRYMYSNGYDLRHFATMSIVPAFAELVIRVYHCARTAHRGEALGKDGIRDRLKLAQMLALTHSMLASGNLVKTALYGWNPAALNYAQFLALGKALISLARRSAERNATIRKELDEGWEALLIGSRRLAESRLPPAPDQPGP